MSNKTQQNSGPTHLQSSYLCVTMWTHNIASNSNKAIMTSKNDAQTGQARKNFVLFELKKEKILKDLKDFSSHLPRISNIQQYLHD